MHTYIHVDIYTCIHIYIYIHVCIYTYIYIYTGPLCHQRQWKHLGLDKQVTDSDRVQVSSSLVLW